MKRMKQGAKKPQPKNRTVEAISKQPPAYSVDCWVYSRLNDRYAGVRSRKGKIEGNLQH
jgi:hypothetical protein